MTNRRRALVLVAIGSVIGVAVGCNQIFGVGDYSVVKDAGASSSGSSGSSGQPDGASCDNFDPAKGQCYPCAPTKDIEFLNTCTNSTCIPFDDKARTPLLGADGKLPPVPDLPPDGG